MKVILIDTNGLISFITTRNLEQNSVMFELFTNNNFRINVISNVISEFIYVMDKIYKTEQKVISQILKDLIKMPSVDFIEGYFPEMIFKLWPAKINDFGDSVITAASIINKIPLYTFDKKLSLQLKRISCSHILLSEKTSFV